ncbi:MAG: arylsulfatase [Novosphingobium sp.]|nr:arylsulfatase [Novosphingobium sp.]
MTHVLLSAGVAMTLLSSASIAREREASDNESVGWPHNPAPGKNAPNILLIMTDDVGFSASSAYGGPIATPAFDRLAQKGIKYNQFNTTAMCSPTRASLLTGRNPHNVGMGGITNLASSYAGYNTSIPKSTGTVAQVLKEAGYNTAMFGKSHLTPVWEMTSNGPFDRWPTGLGFQYFYGFLGADASQFEPALTENTVQLNQKYPEGYTLDADLANRAITWIDRQHAIEPDRPFFMYYATGSAHSPNHAPDDWLQKFKGKFDAGWDKVREETFARQKAAGIIPHDTRLTPRPKELPAWNSLDDNQKKLAARYMEAYAASLAYADAQIGRVIQHLEDTGQADNTLIVFIQGDNGSSGEGGLTGAMFEQSAITFQREDQAWNEKNIDNIGKKESYSVIPAPWAWALDTPFQWTKQIASHLGGVRNGLVISWPGHISNPGTVRPQYHFVSDIMPTLLDVAGVSAPALLDGVKQKPLDGVSMAYTFRNPAVPTARKDQVFELLQNMAIYSDGWIASTTPIRMPWNWAKPIEVDAKNRVWELYNLSQDFSQSRNLAEENPKKLEEMKELFWKRAEENSILPIHDYLDGVEGRPDPRAGRSQFLYLGKVENIAEQASPPTIGNSYTISIDLTVPSENADGVILAQGGRYGGYSLYLDKGRLAYHYNAIGKHQYTVTSDKVIPPGDHKITVNFAIDGKINRAAMEGGPGGVMTISVDGSQVSSGRIGRTLVNWYSDVEGLDIGRDNNSPVTDAYPAAVNVFPGEIRSTLFSIR